MSESYCRRAVGRWCIPPYAYPLRSHVALWHTAALASGREGEAGMTETRTGRQGATLVSTRTGSASLCSWFVCMLVVCIASTNAWSDTDKTTVDLERGQPEAASRYHRPRAVHRYEYDKTEVDLAAPLAQPSSEDTSAPQRPATLAPPVPAPTTPPPPAPPPGGGR